MRSIDLNCDMGELPELQADGTEEALMERVSSVNVACGAHAGDEETMDETIRAALRHRLAIGAHPGFPDRANFGRHPLPLPVDVIERTVFEQVTRLAGVAARRGATIGHVKPHGALYNLAARDAAVARAIARGVERSGREVILVGLAGSIMLEVFREAGFRAAGEAFADRRYERDGTLRERALAGALLTDPAQAAGQALRITRDGCVLAADGSRLAIAADTICIHGDTPGAARIAAEVVAGLRAAAVEIRALGR
ncbi:MAG TPA: 5-oxoprolinase subunit PxpA [Candidatus Polarisedimenticolia bacterium]|nr:5-oxoprolinase subunit PxpA [Candidatus Polarisedimenticolia bacterium]